MKNIVKKRSKKKITRRTKKKVKPIAVVAMQSPKVARTNFDELALFNDCAIHRIARSAVNHSYGCSRTPMRQLAENDPTLYPKFINKFK